MEACSRNRCCAILSLSIRRCSPSLYLLLTYSLITRSRFGSACFSSSCAHLTTLARSFTQWLFDWFLGLIVVSLCDFTLYIPISNFLVHTFSSFEFLFRLFTHRIFTIRLEIRTPMQTNSSAQHVRWKGQRLMFAVAICMHFLYDLVKMARNEKLQKQR